MKHNMQTQETIMDAIHKLVSLGHQPTATLIHRLTGVPKTTSQHYLVSLQERGLIPRFPAVPPTSIMGKTLQERQEVEARIAVTRGLACILRYDPAYPLFVKEEPTPEDESPTSRGRLRLAHRQLPE